MNILRAMTFPLSTDLIVFHRIWYVVPSLVFNLQRLWCLSLFLLWPTVHEVERKNLYNSCWASAFPLVRVCMPVFRCVAWQQLDRSQLTGVPVLAGLSPTELACGCFVLVLLAVVTRLTFRSIPVCWFWGWPRAKREGRGRGDVGWLGWLGVGGWGAPPWAPRVAGIEGHLPLDPPPARGSPSQAMGGHVRVVLASLLPERSKATKPSARSTRLLPGVMLPQ